MQVESIADPETILPKVKSDKPYPTAYLDIQPADEAYEFVLANAGATRPKRDAVDERIVNMVRTGQVTAQAGENLLEELGKVGYAENVMRGIARLVEKGIITEFHRWAAIRSIVASRTRTPTATACPTIGKLNMASIQ